MTVAMTEDAPADRRVVAVFDLDCTLTRRDSLIPWLVELRGWRRTAVAAARSGMVNPLRRDTGAGDLRTRIKQRLLARLLAGVPVDTARQAARAVARRIPWNLATLRSLEQHRAQGHRVLVATGSATLCAEAMLGDRLGAEGITVIGTGLEVEGNHLTGQLAGPNCVRLAKAAQVAAWMTQHGPFDERWGYGNAPHDLPMLALMDHRMVV